MRERGNPFLRFFDQYLGPPLLFVLGKLTFRRMRPAEFRSVIILKPAALGDLMLLSAVVSDLKQSDKAENNPRHITLLVTKSNLPLAELLTGIDEILTIDFSRPLELWITLRKSSYDLVIDADSWPRITALMALLIPAKWRIGFRTSGQYRHYALDQTVEHRNDVHEIENYRSLLRALELSAGHPPQNLSHLGPLRPSSGKIMLHMFPGGRFAELKEWPKDHWLQLVDRLAKEIPNLEIVVSGGPADQLRVDQFLENLKHRNLQARRPQGKSLRDTVSELQSTQCLIAVNTGIMHIAACMGVPVVALNGPTNPKRWGPLGARCVSLLAKSPEAATLNLGFEYRNQEQILATITVDEVLKAVRSTINSTISDQSRADAASKNHAP